MNDLLQTKTPADAGKAVIYLRVSTDEQVDNYSMETQESICKKEAERKNHEIMQIFREEGRSAKTIAGRPALVEMLEFCRKHKKEISTVIIYRLDRISRQTADYLAIRKKLAECDIKLISTTEPTGNSPTEKFVETMLASFAQMDNDVRSERSKNGMRARFEAGLSNGTVPLGYLNQNGYAIKDPKTFDIMQKGWGLMATGTKSLRGMAEVLTKQGIKGGPRNSKKEYKLRRQMLNMVFRNKFYAGKIVSKKYGMEVQGQHPAMVSEEKFYKVQSVLDGRNTNIAAPLARRNIDNPDFPLRRIVKCTQCGASMTGGWCKGKRKHYAYYFCLNKCKGLNTKRAKINEETLNELTSIALKSKATDYFIAWLRQKYYTRLSSLKKRRDGADIELKSLYEFRQSLIEKNISGVYSDEIFQEQNKIVESKIQTVQVTKNDDMIQKYNLEAITSFAKSKLENVAQTFVDSDLQGKRSVLCSIYPSGLHWNGNVYLNTVISPFYSAILTLKKDVVSFGTPGRIRTYNLLVRSQALYPLSYGGEIGAANGKLEPL